MTRKEEVRNASVTYNEKCGKLLVIGGDNILSEEEYLEFNKNPSFIAGAEWADKTMVEKVYNFIRINAYRYRQLKFVKNKATFDFRTDRLIEDLRKFMEK